MPNDSNNKHIALSPALQYSFAALSSCFEHTFIHPVDNAVHRLQNATEAEKAKTYAQRMLNFNRIIFTNNGAVTIPQKVVLLYKGFFVSGLHKTLSRTFKYGTQPIIAASIEHHLGPSIRASLGSQTGSQMIGALAGAAVGIGETVFTPLDRYKILRQLGFNGSFTQFLQTERMAVFKGLGAAIARNVPGSFALFFASSGMKSHFVRQNIEKKGNPDLSLSQHFMSATVGAVAATVTTNPQEVVKTRVMARQGNASAFSILKQTVVNEGVSTLGRGLFLRSIFAIPKLGIPMTLSFFLPEAYQRYQERSKSTSTHTPRP
jgi:hypothetical protein